MWTKVKDYPPVNRHRCGKAGKIHCLSDDFQLGSPDFQSFVSLLESDPCLVAFPMEESIFKVGHDSVYIVK